MANVVTEIAVEVLESPTSPNVLVTEFAVEVLESPSSAAVRVTEFAVEVLFVLPPPYVGPPMRVPAIIGG